MNLSDIFRVGVIVKLKSIKSFIAKTDKKILIVVPIILILMLLRTCSKSEDDNSSAIKPGEPQSEEEFTPKAEDTKSLFIAKLEEDSLQENTQFNMNKGGLIARSGDYYYFAESSMGLLYRVRVDGTKREKLDGLPYVKNIFLQGGIIYYTPRVFDLKGNVVEAPITSLNIATGQRTITKLHASMMFGDAQYIYFTNLFDENALYRTNYTFTDIQKLSEDKAISNFYLQDQKLYVLVGEGILQMKTDGSERKLVYNSTNIASFLLKDQWIYYISKKEKQFFVLPLGKPEERKLLVNTVASFEVIEDVLYYRRENTGNLLYAKIGDITISMGSVSGGAMHTILGTMMFTKEKNGLGFTHKVDLRNGSKQSLVKDSRETKLGFNQERVLEKVMVELDYDDRNTITKKIFQDLARYFDGNSIPVYRQFLDVDNDYLFEGFIIFRQRISEQSTQLAGLGVHGDFQAGLYILRWSGNELNVLGPYKIASEKTIANGVIVKPQFTLYDITRNNKKEVILDLYSTKKSKNLTIYEVFPVHLETREATEFKFVLDYLGFSFRD